MEKFVFQKMMSASQRTVRVWPVPRVGAAADKMAESVSSDAGLPQKVLVQTHLDGHHGWKGATAKIWQIENWLSVIAALHDCQCDVAVMEWDAVAMARIKNECPYIRDVGKGGLWELCSQMSDFDCVVSVDSWVKYAAAWHKNQQVILVPDLRNGYTPDFAGITADWIAAWWFHGLINDPNVKIIGLKKESGKFEFSLAKLADLKPEQLLQEIKLKLNIR